jgi:glutaredoxin
MQRLPLPAAGLCGVLAFALAAAAAAQERQVYRYIDADGRTVYSDRAPTGQVKDLQSKRVAGNTIETSTMPLALQQATERYPVTLYTFACGEACDRAAALLNRRGIPHTTLNVEDGNNAQKLQQLTGELQAPVLQVGDKLVAKGFGESQWNAMLDQAGYPKSAPRRNNPVKPGESAEEPPRTAAAPR